MSNSSGGLPGSSDLKNDDGSWSVIFSDNPIPTDLELQIDDGSLIKVHSQIIGLNSPVLAVAISLLQPLSDRQIQVEGSRDQWNSILRRIYPCRSSPWTMEAAYLSLPLLDRYNFFHLLDQALEFCIPILPAYLSVDRESPGCVLSWLKLSDSLTFDSIKSMCITFIQEAAFKQKIEGLIFRSIAPHSVRSVRITPPTPRPTRCPRFSHSAATGSLACSIEYCESCSVWGCRSLGCRDCGGPLFPSKPKRVMGRYWLGENLPYLSDDVKELSKELIIELMSALSVVHMNGYVNFRVQS